MTWRCPSHGCGAIHLEWEPGDELINDDGSTSLAEPAGVWSCPNCDISFDTALLRDHGDQVTGPVQETGAST